MNEMRQPRCGVPDVDVHDQRLRVKRSWLKSKWSKTDLKYYFSHGEDLSESDQSRIIAEAFQVWRNVAPKLKFTRTYSLYNADFKIRFCTAHDFLWGKGSEWGSVVLFFLLDFFFFIICYQNTVVNDEFEIQFTFFVVLAEDVTLVYLLKGRAIQRLMAKEAFWLTLIPQKMAESTLMRMTNFPRLVHFGGGRKA